MGTRGVPIIINNQVVGTGKRDVTIPWVGSIGEFSPTIGVRIARLSTTMTYGLPAGETPTLPQKVVTHVRGTAFWLKSLDADMTVTFSEYAKAGKR